jgi:AraC-like DNA-binding protein
MIDALPAPALRGLVSHYCLYSEETHSFTARQELATTSAVLIYALGEPLEIVGADGRSILLRQGQGFAGAISDRTSLSRADGAQSGVHVFMPLNSLATVIRMPLAEIANRVVTMRDLLGPDADELGGRLVEAREAEQRFELLDAFLADRLADQTAEDRTVRWAMARLSAAASPSSSILAGEIGWSRRHFARRFRDATGFGPDRFRRIGRFQRFVEHLIRSPGEPLAALALDSGYADQPHLARDVRDFADATPRQLRERLIPEGGGIRDN